MANLATIDNNILADSGIDPIDLIVGTGTVNYVPKFTAEGTIGNSQIFDNGTNVGIGTASPSYKLDVLGSFSFTTGGNYLQYNSGILYHGNYYQFPSGNNYLLFARASGDLVLGANDVERMRITASGNVGIGTSSPLAKLQVSGGRAYFFSGDNYSVGLAQTAAQAKYMYLGTASDGTFYISETSGTARVTVQQGGNVGIGTSSPSFLLTVSGKIYSSTEIQASTAVMNTTGGYASFGSNSGSIPVRVSRDASLSDIIIDTTGYVGIGTSTPSDKLHVSGNLRVTGTIIDSNNSPGTSGQVLSSTATGTDWVSLSEITGVDGTGTANYVAKWLDANTITNSLLYDDGTNVGIGTTAPGARFTVQTTTSSSAHTLRVTDGTGIINIGHWDTVTNRFEFSGKPTYFVQYGAGNYISFGTLGSENMRIEAGGNIGIGTSTPAVKLHVVGDGYFTSSVAITSGVGTAVGQLSLYASPATNVVTNLITAQYSSNVLTSIQSLNAGGYYQDLIINTSNGAGAPTLAEVFRIKGQTGNVGIGTNAPSAKLSVVGDSELASFTSSTLGGTYSVFKLFNLGPGSTAWRGNVMGGNIKIVSNAPAIDVNGFAGSAIVFGSDSGQGFLKFYTTTSNVSGTALSLALTLNVDGSAAFAGTIYGTNFNASNGGYFGWGDASTRIDGDSSNQYVRVVVNSSEKMRVTSGGDVGIGTSAPDSKLAVVSSGSNLFRMVRSQNNFGFEATATSSGGYGLYDYQASAYDIYFKAGNVGIGTTTPSQKLHLNIASGAIYTRIQNNLNSLYLGLESGGIAQVSSDVSSLKVMANTYTSFETAGVERMRITSAGNVGIGTSSPNEKLVVEGNSARIKIQTAGDPSTYYTYLESNWNAANTFNIVDGGSSKFGSKALVTYNDTYINSYYNVYIATGTTENTSASNIRLFVTSAGNIGIGNTAPLRKLHVSGNFAVNANATQYYGVYIPANGEGASPTILIGDWWNASGNLTWDSSNKIFNINSLYGSNAAPITFSGNGTERMRITTAGDVGIGISSPITKLQVAGGVTVGSSSTAIVNFYMTRNNGGVAADANYFVSANNTPNHTWIEGGYYTGELSGVVTAPNSGYPYIETWAGQGGSTTKSFGFINKTSGSFTATDLFVTMSLARTGLVRFNQYGTGAFTGARAFDLAVDSLGNIIEVPVGAGTITGSGTTNYVPKFTGASSIGNSVLYDDGTDVGIGTTSPAPYIDGGAARGLQISNAGRAGIRLHDTGGVVQYFDIGVNGSTAFISAIYSQTPTIKYQAASNHIFENNSSESMRITSAGNIGIGTSAPNQKLQVNGFVNATGYVNSGTTFIKSFNIGNISAGATFALGRLNFESVYTHHFRVTITSYYGSKTFDFIGYQTYLNKTVSGISGGGDVVIETILDAYTQVIGVKIGITTGVADYVYTATVECLSTFSSWEDYSSTTTITPTSIGYTNSAFAIGGGNVGIGTTSPVSIGTGVTTLDIQGSSAGGVAFGPSGIKNYIYGASTMYIEAHTTAVFATSGSEKMRLTTGGQLIVGGTTVGYAGTKLQVGNTSDIQNGLNILTSTTGYGYILFGDGAGADTYVGQIWYYHADNYMGFQTNGSEKMRITSTGNMGIGTTDPQYKLDVAQVIRSNYGSNEGRLYLGSTPAGVGYAAGAIRATPSPSYSYTGKLSFYTTTWGVGSDYGITEQMYIDTTAADTKASTLVMLPWGGNVGIGTTSPTSILDASVSSGATSGFRFKGWSDASTPYLLSLGTQTYQDIFQIKSVNGLVTMGIVGAVGSTPDLAFQTNSTERMRITSGGNVGIGTSNPIAKLHVAGTAYFTSDVSAAIFNSTSLGTATVASTGWYKIASIDTRGGGTIQVCTIGGSYSPTTYNINYYKDWSNAGTLQLSQYGPSSWITDARIRQDSANNIYYVEIYVAAVAAFEVYHQKLLGYNATGTVFTGALAAGSASGTTITQLPFRTYGLTTQGITLTPFNNTSAVAFQRNVSGTIYNLGSITNSGSDIVYQGTGNVFINADSDGDSTSEARNVIFGNRGVEYMRVNGSGYVGIGTTAPNEKLDVRGNIYIPQNNYIYFDNSGHYIRRGASDVEIQGYNGIQLRTSGTTRLYINEIGNVGIGTTAPAYKLQVESGTNASVAIVGAAGYQTALELKGADQWYRLISQPSINGYRFDIYNQTLGAFAFSIASNLDTYLYGKAGIGTTSPQSRLDLAPPASQSTVSTLGYSANAQLNIRIPNSTGDIGQIVFTNDAAPTAGYASIGVIMTNGTGVGIGDIIMCTKSVGSDAASTERMRINSSGYVSIGTSSADEILTVAGKIKASSMYVYDGLAAGQTGIGATASGGTLRLYSNGNIGATITSAGAMTVTSSVTATGFFESSDARLKTIVDENYRHNAIANIKPKFYEKNGKFEAGYIAQDVQEIYEHAVSLGTDGYLSLSYGQIHTLKIAYLEDTVEEIKRKIAYLEQQLNNK